MITGAFICIFLSVLAQMLLPRLMGQIVDIGVIQGDSAVLWNLGFQMIAISIGAILVSVFSARWSAYAAMGIARDLRTDLFRKIQTFSLQEVQTFSTSSLIIRSTNDIQQVQQMILMSLRMMVRFPLMFVSATILAFRTSPQLAPWIFVALPVAAVMIAFISRVGMPLFRQAQEKIDRLNQVLREFLTGVRVVRAFDKGEYESRRFDTANADLRELYLKIVRIMSAVDPIMSLSANMVIVILLYFASGYIDKGWLGVGDLMAFVQYVNMILFSMMMVSMLFIMLPRAQTSVQRIFEVMETETAIVDPAEPKEIATDCLTLCFDDVSYRYPGAENCALEDVSFTAERGEVTAIVGGTGTGKSTLLYLIERLFDPTEGSIRLCGTDIRDLTKETLREAIGYVPQHNFLFTGNVLENTEIGADENDEEQTWNALKIAEASEFVGTLPDGLLSEVASGGRNFSGGQRQRLAIARAVRKDPLIYLFDDSFSALDFATDRRVRENLAHAIRDKIVLVVAQRISTVRDADRIIVLDEGRVEGIGTHEELLKTSRVYQETWALQTKEGA